MGGKICVCNNIFVDLSRTNDQESQLDIQNLKEKDILFVCNLNTFEALAYTRWSRVKPELSSITNFVFSLPGFKYTCTG